MSPSTFIWKHKQTKIASDLRNMVRKTLLVKPLETAPTIEVGKPAQTPKQSNRKKASTIQKES